MFAQAGGVGEETVGDVHGVADEAGDDVVRGGTVLDEAEDEGGGLMGECLDIVGLQDDPGRVVSGGLCGDLGRGGQPVGCGDGGRGRVDGGEELRRPDRVLLQEAVGGGLDGGGVLPAQQDGLLRASGEVTEFGAFDGPRARWRPRRARPP